MAARKPPWHKEVQEVPLEEAKLLARLGAEVFWDWIAPNSDRHDSEAIYRTVELGAWEDITEKGRHVFTYIRK